MLKVKIEEKMLKISMCKIQINKIFPLPFVDRANILQRK